MNARHTLAATVAFTALVLAAPADAQEEPSAVPSGLILYLQEVLVEDQPDGSVWLRYRYYTDGLADADYDLVSDDFQAICEQVVLPSDAADTASQVVISIASEPSEFGASTPSITQFFEAFRLEGGACIWEGF